MSNFIVAFVTIIKTLMKAGRPAREETPYKIIIHVNGGRRYASTKINFTAEDGRKISKHQALGIDRREQQVSSQHHLFQCQSCGTQETDLPRGA